MDRCGCELEILKMVLMSPGGPFTKGAEKIAVRRSDPAIS
jgi:hypothetical protein